MFFLKMAVFMGAALLVERAPLTLSCGGLVSNPAQTLCLSLQCTCLIKQKCLKRKKMAGSTWTLTSELGSQEDETLHFPSHGNTKAPKKKAWTENQRCDFKRMQLNSSFSYKTHFTNNNSWPKCCTIKTVKTIKHNKNTKTKTSSKTSTVS